ncbi:tripartite tricarboxylate transporter TctB family protein [Halocella sp. SP3-1]|uniref:tripartite tricarboxylate transporter TctB family protein n=1 Tax=Halocella sp. SP3-1 TaxID=2382161 RepID=UPI000F761FCB|nr:tripartite tricarboxylate transporter TctB family protein [Halocella sp. SP3-1]AZO94861.1 tripartite tricarboxylate transporter TctB family protein [Halocella sp. SP3-1]
MNIRVISGLLAIIIGCIYSILAYNLPRATVGNPIAPILFPLGLGVTMLIFGIILFIKESKKERGLTEEKRKNQRKVILSSGKLVIITCLSSIIYALLFERIGYVLSTLLFMGLILFAINGKENWKINVLVAVCFSVGIYFIFLKLLGIPLPSLPVFDI